MTTTHDEIEIRHSIARQAVAALPPGEVRARHALSVLDRFVLGDASLVELVRAGRECRRVFRSYARLRRHAVCLAYYATYDAIDRLAKDHAPTPRETLLVRIVLFLVGWLWRTPALPRPEPYPDTPYRTATTLDHLDSRDRP